MCDTDPSHASAEERALSAFATQVLYECVGGGGDKQPAMSVIRAYLTVWKLTRSLATQYVLLRLYQHINVLKWLFWCVAERALFHCVT
jgi:hypothetical protein